MAEQKTFGERLRAFASLNWYEELIKFIFNFVTKTSELLLAAGIVISTANFLTDGDIMSHNKGLTDAWSWAQALAIDSSLGIVFINGFQAVREREKVKAIIFFTLTALLATVAGLITHFDAYSHASGLPVSDKSVSGIIPLWIMTALRAVAVIGFLLTSRLKNFSFNALHQELHQNVPPTTNQQPLPAPIQGPTHIDIDYQQLAKELAPFLQAVRTTIIEEVRASITAPEPAPLLEARATSGAESQNHAETGAIAGAGADLEPVPQIELEPVAMPLQNRNRPRARTADRAVQEPEPGNNLRANSISQAQEPGPGARAEMSVTQEQRLEQAYQELVQANAGSRVSGRALAKRAKVHRQTATEWLRTTRPENADAQGEGHHEREPEPDLAPSATSEPEPTVKLESETIIDEGAVQMERNPEDKDGTESRSQDQQREPEPETGATQEPELGVEPSPMPESGAEPSTEAELPARPETDSLPVV